MSPSSRPRTLRRIDLEELGGARDRVDEAALATADIDAYCSSTAWVLSAHEAFHPEQEPFVFAGDHGWLVLARGETAGLGRYLAPLEAMWGLASPLLGPDPALATVAAETLLACKDEWDALWLCGLREGSPAFTRLALSLGRRFRLFLGPKTVRHVAALDGGFEGFLGRRSRKFRANARRALRKAEEEGVLFEWHASVPDEAARALLYARLLDVDDRSWKGLGKEGLRSSQMAAFYDRMTRRLAETGRLRAVVARIGDTDAAMGFGAVFGDSFRGLQMSFDDRFRDLSLGNVVQLELVRRLSEEGVRSYDLGTDIGYKHRWAEPGLETLALVVRP